MGDLSQCRRNISPFGAPECWSSPAWPGHRAWQAKTSIRVHRTEKYFDGTVKDLPCDARGRDIWPTIRASAVLYSRLKPIPLQPARASTRAATGNRVAIIDECREGAYDHRHTSGAMGALQCRRAHCRAPAAGDGPLRSDRRLGGSCSHAPRSADASPRSGNGRGDAVVGARLDEGRIVALLHAEA